MKWSFLEQKMSENPEEETETEDDGITRLKWLLALLRAQYWSYQHSHWTVMGNTAYGDHLLFQRLYDGVRDQIDGLAEKMVGTYGVESINSEDLLSMFVFWNERWDEVDCLHRRGLTSERDLQDVIEDTYETLKESDELSLGMDDFLMATASEHETNQYLLRQILRSKTAMTEWVPLKKD